MEKLNRDILNALEAMVNCEVIRTRPTEKGNVSYTNEPMLLLKVKRNFTGSTRLVVTYPSNCIDGKVKGKSTVLDAEFTDDAWITYHNAKFSGDSPLNQWKGKPIKRCRATKYGNTSWMCNNPNEKPPILIHANEHHMLLNDENGKEIFLGPDYTNPEDWTLAE